MSELQKHIGPNQEKEKSFKNILLRCIRVFGVIWHGLVPHKQPKEPEKKIHQDYFSNNDEIYYTASLEMYKESKERIKLLEEKAFKLLTYISALSAILFFFLSKEIKGFTNVLVIISIGILVIAMIISLRCVGIKTQMAFFINGVFSFKENDVKSLKQNEIAANLMNCAVFNQKVADNTTDILKASRYVLSIGIITIVFALFLFITTNNFSTPKEIQTVKVQLSDSTIIDLLKAKIDIHKNELIEVNKNLKLLNGSIIENKIQLDSINKSIKNLQTIKSKHIKTQPNQIVGNDKNKP